MSPIPVGVVVREHTIVVQKRRFCKLGIFLRLHHPQVTRSDHPEFREGDILYVVNGRHVTTSRAASRTIWRRRHLSITILRPESQRL